MAHLATEAAAVASVCLIQEDVKTVSVEGSQKTTLLFTFEKPVFGLPDSLLCPVFQIVSWLLQHFEMMRTGAAPSNLKVEFSAIVATSSLVYLGVAATYYYQACPLMAALFSVVTVTSLFSDSIQPDSKTWCCLDRSVATLGVLLGPARALLFYASNPFLQLEIIGLSIFAILFLAWSRQSNNMNEYILRHTCWHVVSAAGLVWMAFQCPFNIDKTSYLPFDLNFVHVQDLLGVMLLDPSL